MILMLKLSHVSAAYGKKQVLNDISCEVRDHELAILIGSNGSGKSTLLKAVFGLVDIMETDNTQITFDGTSILGAPTSSLLAAGLMYIPQKKYCFETLTVRENLEVSGLLLTSRRLYNDRRDQVLDMFPMLATSLKRLPMTMSAGERQVLALGMALLHRPKLIMLDEPFAGLSPHNVELFKNLIRRLNAEDRITFLIVEHRLGALQGWPCHAIVLKMGKVCADQIVCDDVSEQIADMMF